MPSLQQALLTSDLSSTLTLVLGECIGVRG